ncbi:hypothetical protein KR059_012653 [Drosophila kikkawai]|nr:hypothetical protein KR059_012653 [Drosophila kikkawai]
MSSHISIINLPEEVLNLVYKYIPEMKDKLNLAKSHCVLGKAFALHVGGTFKEIEIAERPIGEWSVILALCGSSVTRIMTTAVNTTVTVVKLASKHCPNLEEFFFPVRSRSWNQIKSLLLNLRNLTWIGLMNNFEKANVIDTLLKMPKLKNLHLVGFNRQDWESVGKLVNLTELTIMNKKEESADIFKVCSPLKNIDSLEFKSAFIRVPKNHGELWPKIDLLRFNYGIFNTPLPYLPSLKYLTIDSISPHMNLTDVFGQSVYDYGKTLESLRFCTQIPRMIDTDDLGVIMKLKALKRLDCQVGGDDFVHYLSQLENLEKVILQNSRLTNRGAMMMIYRCKKLRDLDLFECPWINRYLVMEAFLALCTLRPPSETPFVLRVSPFFGPVDTVS